MTRAAAGWQEGLGVLRERVARLPTIIRAMPAMLPELGALAPQTVRCFITTGVGSSEAHARFLSAWLSSELGLSSRFVPLSALASAPLPGSGSDVLCVFSQGLSPNARLALRWPGAWRKVILATAVTAAGAARPGAEAKQRLLDQLEAAGGTVVRFPEEDEYTTLVRVIGPLAGYLAAARIAAAIGARHGTRGPSIDQELVAARIEAAGAALEGAIAGVELATLADRLAFLSSGEYGELSANLRYKVLEGMLAPLPPSWDLLHFAHGPFQQVFPSPAVLVALTRQDAPAEADLLARLERMLVRGRHSLVRLDATLPGLLAILEHEAMLNHLMLRVIEARGIDQVRWPGRGLDGPLYDVGGDAHETSVPAVPAASRVPGRRLEELTWPEAAALLASGHQTAVIALGAVEQHGQHLPFATDSRIAEALAARFCARVEGSIQLPTVTVGCSPEHMGFPGTLSLRGSTLAALLEDLLTSCRRHGFERAFVFTAHGGNYGPLRECLAALREAAAPLQVIAFLDHDRLTGAFHAASAYHRVDAESSGHHAGEFETSILRAIWPETVRLDRLEPGLMGRLERPGEIFYPSLKDHAPNGTVGDPRTAAAERAEGYLEAWVDVLVAAYREAL
jgi:creatinine amidohydrolase/Fe(II)-dependent formamide hydrolase-like protein/fructoselysine-6-P-deglycase FrlB-like protein